MDKIVAYFESQFQAVHKMQELEMEEIFMSPKEIKHEKEINERFKHCFHDTGIYFDKQWAELDLQSYLLSIIRTYQPFLTRMVLYWRYRPEILEDKDFYREKIYYHGQVRFSFGFEK